MSARPRETLIPVGPVVATIGAILLVVSLFLDWYEGPAGGGITGFTVFEFLDLLLTGLAVVMLVWLADAIGLIRSGMRPRGRSLRRSFEWVMLLDLHDRHGRHRHDSIRQLDTLYIE